jgi:hypothetical protein
MELKEFFETDYFPFFSEDSIALNLSTNGG